MVLRYIRANWIYSTFIGYMLFSCILKIITGLNITIPCLFKTFLGFHCPGCGLTSAFIELLKLNPERAWDHNPLIFLVLPVGVLLLILSFLKFRKMHSNKPVLSN